MPFNEAINYLALNSKYSEFMVITNLYKDNQTISFVPQHKFFYSNINVKTFKKTLEQSPVYAKLDFNNIFNSKIFQNGYIGIKERN